MAYAVLVPERFRGGCPFGVIVVGVEPDELSRGPCWPSQSTAWPSFEVLTRPPGLDPVRGLTQPTARA